MKINFKQGDAAAESADLLALPAYKIDSKAGLKGAM